MTSSKRKFASPLREAAATRITTVHTTIDTMT
nr:MAG TPA: hypothetical protein [Caudoviricetes sp.]